MYKTNCAMYNQLKNLTKLFKHLIITLLIIAYYNQEIMKWETQRLTNVFRWDQNCKLVLEEKVVVKHMFKPIRA